MYIHTHTYIYIHIYIYLYVYTGGATGPTLTAANGPYLPSKAVHISCTTLPLHATRPMARPSQEMCRQVSYVCCSVCCSMCCSMCCSGVFRVNSFSEDDSPGFVHVFFLCVCCSLWSFSGNMSSDVICVLKCVLQGVMRCALR